MTLPKVIKKLYEKNSSTTIVSNSMFPKLRVGQKVKIIPNARLGFGDIAIWQYKDKILAHRFYFKLGNHCVTKGDNNKKFDLPWDKKHYIGKVQTKVNFREKINMFLNIIKVIPRGVKRLLIKGFLFKRE